MSVSYSAFSVSDFRVVAYIDPSDFKQSKILGLVLTAKSINFDGSVHVFPGPFASADDEVMKFPVIQISSKSEEWAFAATVNSFTCKWTASGDSGGWRENLERAITVITDCLDGIKAKATSFGFVINREAASENSVDLLTSRFCNPEMTSSTNEKAPLRNSRGFQLHNLKRYELESIKQTINSWVRCTAGINNRLKVQQDINTPREDNRNFDGVYARTFFVNAADESNNILHLYFPE